MSPISQLNNTVKYNPRAIELAPVTISTSHLRSPSVAQSAQAKTEIPVKLTHRGIETQSIRPIYLGDDLFVFGDTIEQNTELIKKVHERRDTWHALSFKPGRIAAHTAKTAGVGFLGGAAGGAIIGMILVPSAPVVAVGWAVIGGVTTGAACGIVGAIDAWRAESAMVRMVDLVYNYNDLFKDIRAGEADVVELGDRLLDLYKAGEELGGVGPQLFAEMDSILKHATHPRLVGIRTRFNESPNR